MDDIKVSKVEDVQLEKGQATFVGNLHLTVHHLIFSHPSEEIWISYPTIHTVEKGVPTAYGAWPLHIRCHNFVFVCFNFKTEKSVTDVFESIQKRTCIGSVDQLYAFVFKPHPAYTTSDGWSIYNPEAEYKRMGVDGTQWRISDINQSYSFSPTYPHAIVVPTKISDAVLQYAAKFRSKARIPALSYLHWLNKASITRCSQPMVGIKLNRSIQDEKLIEAIFLTTVEPPKEGQRVYSNTATNLIIDARPTANAMVNTAVGAGTENMENYKNCKKSYSGIDNIHVMRESLNRLVEALQELDQKGQVSKAALQRSGWLRHIAAVMDGAVTIVRNIHISSSHVLVHCSDGWDRTAQLTSIAQVCLDPYYRTLRGFQVLIEKEWCSFGHKFMDRCGHLSNDKNFVSLSATNSAANTFANVQSKLYNNKHIRETSPVFQQFLDCVYQIMYQFPTRFEFNEELLVHLHYHVYSCQFGNFLFNCERERELRYQAATKTTSIWDDINSSQDKFLNPQFDPTSNRITEGDQGVLFPDSKAVRYWAKLFNRDDDDLNALEDTTSVSSASGFLTPGERALSEMQGFSTTYMETTEVATESSEDMQENNSGAVGVVVAAAASVASFTNGLGRTGSPMSSPASSAMAGDPLSAGTAFDSRPRASARSGGGGARASNLSEGLTSDDAWNGVKAGAAAFGGNLVDTFSRFRETWYSTSAPSAGSPSSSGSPASVLGIGDGDNGGILGGIGGGGVFGQRNRSATVGRSHSQNRRKGTVDRELTSVAGHTPKPAFEISSMEALSPSPRPSLGSLTLENEMIAGRARAASATSRSASPAARLNSNNHSNNSGRVSAGIRSPRTGSPAPTGPLASGGLRGYDPLSSPGPVASVPPPSPPSSPSRLQSDSPLHPLGEPSSTLPPVSGNGSSYNRSPPQSEKGVAATLVIAQESVDDACMTVAAGLVGEMSLTSSDADTTVVAPPAKELPHPLFVE
ncbi:hypothetical protein BGZ73_007810 [Actinomortierella ambigua]|nr:hypothetical protein BGZ73_007810 [Actinomortierella ambigua]